MPQTLPKEIIKRGLSTQSLCSASPSVHCCLYNLGCVTSPSHIPVSPCTVSVPDKKLVIQSTELWSSVNRHVCTLMALCSLLIGSQTPQASPFSSELPGPGFCTCKSSHEPQPSLGKSAGAGELPTPMWDFFWDFQLHLLSQWPPCLPQLTQLLSELYGLPIFCFSKSICGSFSARVIIGGGGSLQKPCHSMQLCINI